MLSRMAATVYTQNELILSFLLSISTWTVKVMIWEELLGKEDIMN
jgi:hypothetical protein